MRSRPRVALAVALVTILGAPLAAGRATPPKPDRPNIVLILSDDQTPETLPHQPPVMPYLQRRIEDPNDHWITFSNAFLNTPLCCPSRATILTGRYSHETGVRSNDDGDRFDDSSTVATWLRSAGYTTALIGKYLNVYPFGRAPYVPPGWSRWFGRAQGAPGHLYYDYSLIQEGFPRAYGAAPSDYSTDVLSSLATSFIRTAPSGSPFLLYFAPSAPHNPWTPPPRYAGSWSGKPLPRPPGLNERDVSDKPAWVRGLPELTPAELRQVELDRRSAYESLRGLDDAVRAIVEALRERGVLDDTVIFFLTDNGLSLGEHRWLLKECPYEECISTPFVVRMPGATAHTDPHLVSNVDLAPTFAALGHATPTSPVSGRSLVPLLEGRTPPGWRSGVLLEWAGGNVVPPWWGIRTKRFAYVELGTGERELYDLRKDPFELTNLAGTPAVSALQARLARELGALRRRD